MDITFKKHRKLKPCLVLKKWSLSSPITQHSNSIFSPTQNKTCLDSFLVLCNSKFCNNGGTHLLYWVRRIYLPTRVSSLFSSFSFFLSSLLYLYSPLRPKNFASLLSFTHWIHHFSLPHSSNQKEQRNEKLPRLVRTVQLRPSLPPFAVNLPCTLLPLIFFLSFRFFFFIIIFFRSACWCVGIDRFARFYGSDRFVASCGLWVVACDGCCGWPLLRWVCDGDNYFILFYFESWWASCGCSSGWWVVVIGLVVLMELAGFGVARSVFGWFGVARFGVVGFSGGANSLMKREVKMKQRSYNGNNSKLFRTWQCTGEGAYKFIKFTGLPLNSIFEFWKQVKPVFCFDHSHPFSWVTEWWKRWLKINPNKCWVLKTGGTHTFWMMKIENWVISLKTLLIETSSKPFFLFRVVKVKDNGCWEVVPTRHVV